MTRPVVGAILAAGLGTRLKPFTNTLPKPLLPLLNTPLVAYAMGHLRDAGIQDIAINIHHIPEAMKTVVGHLQRTIPLDVTFSMEWELLGSGGGLRGLWTALRERDATLVVLNADTVLNIDLTDALKQHRESGASVSLVCRPRQAGQPGRLWRTGNTLTGLRDYRSVEHTAEAREFEFTGIHILEPPALEKIPMETCDVIDTLYGPMLEANESIHTIFVDDFFAAIDSPELLMATSKRVLRNPKVFAQAPLPRNYEDGLFLYNATEIDDSVQFAAPVLAGINSSIAAGCLVGPDVVLDGVEILPGTRLANTILYGMGTLEGEWTNCIGIAGAMYRLPASNALDSEPTP